MADRIFPCCGSEPEAKAFGAGGTGVQSEMQTSSEPDANEFGAGCKGACPGTKEQKPSGRFFTKQNPYVTISVTELTFQRYGAVYKYLFTLLV